THPLSPPWAPAAASPPAARPGGGVGGGAGPPGPRPPRRGARATAAMRPSAGRARFAPDHSLGTEDPGANTVALVLESWAEQLSSEVRV
ncbi:MAG: DAK2 domain-containing protein, partial [Acidimicrobiia bacterium]|nr:DAK2 domain-containing protein [Acidimicrobiia bacterium]